MEHKPDPDCESCSGTGDQGGALVYKRCNCQAPDAAERLRRAAPELLAKAQAMLDMCETENVWGPQADELKALIADLTAEAR